MEMILLIVGAVIVLPIAAHVLVILLAWFAWLCGLKGGQQ